MSDELIYKEYARYYDLIYSYKDYKQEAERVHELVQQYKRSADNKLLDVGCGTGKHVLYLNQYYSCTGTDLNEGILQVAKTNCPETEFIKSDMALLDIGRQFDVITSLFSSIGYVLTRERLKDTLQGMAMHLRSGGVLIVEPWITPQNFESDYTVLTTYEDEHVKIARMGQTELRDNNISFLQMHYLISERGRKVLHFTDDNLLGLFTTEEILADMAESGLQAEFIQDDLFKRGLFVAVKQ